MAVLLQYRIQPPRPGFFAQLLLHEAGHQNITDATIMHSILSVTRLESVGSVSRRAANA